MPVTAPVVRAARKIKAAGGARSADSAAGISPASEFSATPTADAMWDDVLLHGQDVLWPARAAPKKAKKRSRDEDVIRFKDVEDSEDERKTKGKKSKSSKKGKIVGQKE